MRVMEVNRGVVRCREEQEVVLPFLRLPSTSLDIPLFLRNDRAVGLRHHIVGYLRFRVILEGESPVIVIAALALVHREVGPL